MFAPEVKQFILDDNMRRTMTASQKVRVASKKDGTYLAQSRGQVKYNLNDTMPVGSQNFNLLKQTQADLLHHQNSDSRLNEKINMEAYQAYYNTNEQQEFKKDEARFPKEETQNMKIINNIMHINHSGANINIMCGGDTKLGSGA